MTRPPRATDKEIEALVRDSLDLVPIIAKQVRRQLSPRLDLAELEAAGREGLFAAALAFDPERGVPFRKWAAIRTRGAMLDGLRASGGLPREVYRRLRALRAADLVQEGRVEDDATSPPPNSAVGDARVEETLQSMAMAMAAGFLAASSEGLAYVVDEGLDPEEAVAEKRLLETLRALIAARPEAERRLLERHYFDGVTVDEAAREIGLSKSWASRLHARAMVSLAADAKKLLSNG
ncbi:MAG: sigma-70 family RNA polymerase sigma factor [Myxococcales bacterium]|nr:sigma-70 family RNA polymerase sigma factor [Myxococcales bacterium]